MSEPYGAVWELGSIRFVAAGCHSRLSDYLLGGVL